MVSHLFFYHLALIALVWLFFLLLYAGPSARARRPHPAAPSALHRQRSTAPKPFAGLPQKPHCARCEQDVPPPQAPPAVRPAPMPPPPRRPRTVETSTHFCPHTGWRYRGWLGLGNLRAHGHPSGGPGRPCHCTAGKGYFPEHHGTRLHGNPVAVELIVRVLACLAEGLGIRATARVFEVAPDTVLPWLVEAAEPLRAFAQYFLCAVHVRQVQLDEWYAVLRAVKDGHRSEAEALERLERSPSWGWSAMDPARKRLLVIDVGPRPWARAQRGVHRLVQMLAPECVPLFLTDGCKDYATAWLTHCGFWMQPQRRRDPGPASTPRWRPRPQFCYARVVKSSRRRRLVAVPHRLVFGTMDAVKQGLAAGGEASYRVGREAASRYPPAGGGGRSSGAYAVPRRGRLAASAGGMPDLSQLCTAPRQFAPALAGS